MSAQRKFNAFRERIATDAHVMEWTAGSRCHKHMKGVVLRTQGNPPILNIPSFTFN